MPVVTATATGSIARSGNTGLSERVAAAMAKAAEENHRQGITDPVQGRMNILKARAIARGETLPDLDRVPTLVQRITEDQRVAQLNQSMLMEEVVSVLMGTERHVALGAAVALLLSSAETHPHLLVNALRRTMVTRGNRTVCALQALVDSTNVG